MRIVNSIFILVVLYVFSCLSVMVYTTITQFNVAHDRLYAALNRSDIGMSDRCLKVMDVIADTNPFDLPTAIRNARTNLLVKEGCK